MEPWRTAIAHSDSTGIWIRGYDVTALMRRPFTDTVFLLHRGRLPDAAERELLDAVLVGVADHGAGAPSCATARLAASGNRQSLSAAIAAGVLAIGDDHGGAGEGCMVKGAWR
jgi:citrate synthase